MTMRGIGALGPKSNEAIDDAHVIADECLNWSWKQIIHCADRQSSGQYF